MQMTDSIVRQLCQTTASDDFVWQKCQIQLTARFVRPNCQAKESVTKPISGFDSEGSHEGTEMRGEYVLRGYVFVTETRRNIYRINLRASVARNSFHFGLWPLAFGPRLYCACAASRAISSASFLSPFFPINHINPPKKMSSPDITPTAMISPC
jgi:hypothetical protein